MSAKHLAQNVLRKCSANVNSLPVPPMFPAQKEIPQSLTCSSPFAIGIRFLPSSPRPSSAGSHQLMRADCAHLFPTLHSATSWWKDLHYSNQQMLRIKAPIQQSQLTSTPLLAGYTSPSPPIRPTQSPQRQEDGLCRGLWTQSTAFLYSGFFNKFFRATQRPTDSHLPLIFPRGKRSMCSEATQPSDESN